MQNKINTTKQNNTILNLILYLSDFEQIDCQSDYIAKGLQTHNSCRGQRKKIIQKFKAVLEQQQKC